MANAVDERDLGVAGAFQQMMTQLGVVLGIQLMQTVTVVREPVVGEVEAYGEAYLLGARRWPRVGVVVRALRAVEPPARRGRPAGRPRARTARPRWRRSDADAAQSAVISLIFAAISLRPDRGRPDCMAIILVMSPWTLILPAMKACIPACGLPSTRIALAVA